MSFLAPLFLLGALAIAVPFWLHRLQIQSSNRKPFSSAMLLETTEQQVHVQKKLKYLALLALRAALLALIALAFAKPLCESGSGIVFVIFLICAAGRTPTPSPPSQRQDRPRGTRETGIMTGF